MEGSLHQRQATRGSLYESKIVWCINSNLLIVTVLAGAVGLQSAGKYTFSKHEKAYYADANVIDFVRPGLVFKVASASSRKMEQSRPGFWSPIPKVFRSTGSESTHREQCR